MYFQLPTLPFDENALAPFMSRETVRTHYLGHHKAYVDNLNSLLGETGGDYGSIERIIQNFDGPIYNNAAQAWNHTFFWHGLTDRTRSRIPQDNGDLDQAVERSFGGWSSMQEKFQDCASGVFGSGYVWLTVDGRGELEFAATQNAANPLRFERIRPLWCCDLWEHAYYLDYKNQRVRFVEGIWNYVNWEFVESCLLLDGVPNMTKFMIASRPFVPAKGP